MYVGSFLVGMDAVHWVIKLEIKLIQIIVFLTEELSFKVLDLSMAMQMDLVAPSFLVDASGKMAYVTGASVKAFLGCRTLNKDSDSMASFSFAYLFILFSSQGIFFLCYTVSTFNS